MDEYAGAQARFYDQYFCGVEGDVDFYVERARQSGGPVLELGCGSGRTLLPMARAGIPVVGLERAPQMLAQARARLAAETPAVRALVQLVEGDMTDFDLGQSFALITVPYRAFQHLLTPVDQEDALHCIGTHLAAAGRLALNIFDPQRDMVQHWLQGTAPLQWDADFIDAASGRRVDVWYRRHYDPQMQLIEQELVFEETDAAGLVAARHRGRLTLRYTFRHEMEYLLDLCGFEAEALFGDFAGGPYPGWGEQIWIARPAPEPSAT